MESFNSSMIERLGNDNYCTWKMQIKALLVINDAWSFVNGEERKPELQIGEGAAASVLAIKAWENEDKKAKAIILSSISPSEVNQQIKICVSSNELWSKLESIHKSRWPARKVTLLKQLIRHRMQDGDDVREYLRKFFDTVNKLSMMEVDINQDLVTIMLLYSLPPSFENFRCAMESRDELPTPEVLRWKIEGESYSQKRNTRFLNGYRL